MMQFRRTKAHEGIVEAIRDGLAPFDIAAVRADDKEYHEDLLPNVRTYLHGCGFGVAVFERIEAEEFNPNVSLEVGYLLAMGKPVCLLKDRTLKTLHTDLVGRLYRIFDPLDPAGTIPPAISRWLSDRRLA
jgi:nucleoside 2-deoxyribosyltransferase